MRKKLSLTAFLMMICVIGLVSTCKGQSFERARGYSIHAPEGVKAQKHKKTLAKRMLNKVRYARKRHNNEAFALRERRKAIKRNGI